MEKRKLSKSIIIASCILFAGLCVTGYASNRSAIDGIKDDIYGSSSDSEEMTATQVHSPNVPELIVFAGDTVRFDNADMQERMDRELIAFTYSHQISLLMIKRAPKYFPVIEPILKECGVPDDLKYLMVIESNLDPEARSTSGAAGFWQFMPATGKEFGLEVSATVDERYNVEKATRAACKYLKSAYAKYHDWMTVAASYNAGQGGISNRIGVQKQKSAFDLWLPAETSRYMFRILTAKMMLEDPAAFGFKLKKNELYKYEKPARTVTVSGETDLVKLASENGVSFAALHRANPWLRSTTLKPVSNSKKYQIMIPEE